ncbi:MAG: B12-binding domain-containing radical SAM protein [Kiloniellaceae bacterium]
MRGVPESRPNRFLVELIKPSHYDDDGYVVQWWKAWIPSNSLACLYALSLDLADRRALGEDVEIVINAYDETNTVIPVRKIIKRLTRSGDPGLVCLVGVQSNQYPRAMDIARRFRAAGIQVAIGGFHVSGCISMLPELPDDLQEAVDRGITLFAGEAEGRLDHVFADALHGRLKPIYNFLSDLPGLQGQVVPILPEKIVKKYVGSISSFDAGRGCPFQCSFCTIINVQGRKSRWRDADDVERLVRANLARGVHRFFITDDNFARNRNWEAIFDRLIELREKDGLKPHFIIQVDTLCHKIPGFVEKAARAGCTRVFIGLENINPDNLIAAQKRQNRITEYRRMLQAWRDVGVITYAGYILGFANDTPESIKRDIEIIKRELPIDLLEFFCLTPLPGSADHKDLYVRGVPMDRDMNMYDLEHVCTDHPRMSKEQWQAIYREAWDLYYSPEHVETLLKRSAASGIKPVRTMHHVLQFYGSLIYERVHPLQSGYFRRKVRTQRRSGMPLESPLLFYPRRVWEALSTYLPLLAYYVRLTLLRKRIEKDPAMRSYSDLALTPATQAEEEHLDLFEHSDAAKAAVAKAKARAAAGRTAAA